MNYLLRYFYLWVTLLTGSATAATINVGPPPASIQTAINSAMSGDTIQLSAGTYIEQIQVINKSLDIVGTGQNTTTIQAPPASTPLTQYFTYGGNNWWCVVMIDNQATPALQTVNIRDLTVDGSDQQDTATLPPPSPGFYGSANRFFAIGYHEASGTVENVHTTNTRQTVSFNELAGGGIVNASNTVAVTFTVDSCLVDFYQRLGIDCRGSTLTASITNNTVDRGYLLTPNTATATPNGIQFSGGATGSITGNTVENNVSTVAGVQAAGIIPFGAGANLIVSGNAINNNDLGIAAIQNGANITIDSNTLNYTLPPGINIIEGIVVQDTNGLSTVTSNIMNNIPDVGMELISSTDQTFQLGLNQFIGGQTGLIVTGGVIVGPTVIMNGDSFTDTIGYYIQEVDAPHDIWPSTATVFFDGLISGHITFAEYNAILAKTLGNDSNPTLGVILEFIIPSPPTLTNINPPFGPTSGGNTITITGLNFFSSNTTVDFGGIPGTNVVVLSNTSLTVTVPPGVVGIVNVTVSTPFGTTPVVSAGEYTYVLPAVPLPPPNFVGTLKKNTFLNKKEYILSSSWTPSPTPGIVLYRIYFKGQLVQEVPAGSPLVFATCVKSKGAAKQYSITAVNASNVESTPTTIEILP